MSLAKVSHSNQIFLKIKTTEIREILENLFKIKTPGCQDSLLKIKISRLFAILSNLFNIKTLGIPKIFSDLFEIQESQRIFQTFSKSKHHSEVPDILSNLFKIKMGPRNFFQSLSKSKHQSSPRFFQIRSKIGQQKSSIFF